LTRLPPLSECQKECEEEDDDDEYNATLSTMTMRRMLASVVAMRKMVMSRII